MADAEEEAKVEGGEEAKDEAKVEEAKAEEPKAKEEKAEEPKAEAKAEEPKAEAKTEGVKTEGASAPAAGGGGGASKKTVKTLKNHFAMNRLLLMLMDVKPEALTAETIDDLKKVYALLVSIHAQYADSKAK